MRHIAVEEAFSWPELGERLPLPDMGFHIRPEVGRDWERRLADLTGERIAEMDAAGVDVQVLSLTVPGIQVAAAPEAAVAAARSANDYLAQALALRPDRFRGFAALPLQDPAAAVAELTRCVDELGFCGALVNNSASAFYLDDPSFEVLWAALAELDVPLYLHPGSPPADTWHALRSYPELAGAFWSWGAETAAHALRIVLSGVFDRHPGATLLLGHMGEFLPFQRSRFDSRWPTLATERSLARAPSDYIGTNIAVTISGVFSPAVLEGTVAEIGADAVLFAVDYPYEKSQDAVDCLARARLTDTDRHKIAHGNAERLLHLPPA